MDFFSVAYLKGLAHTHLVPFLINLVIAIFVFYVGRFIARLIVKAVDKLMQRSNLDDSLRKFATDLLYGLLLAVVVIAALERLGVKTTAAIAILGAMGLALGLALQGSLGNFASGVMIILFKPYKIGDLIKVGGETGVVEEIKVFITVLVTPDNRTIMIPNGQVTSGTIENLTVKGKRRVDMTFGIGYDDDIKAAKTMIEQVVAAHPKVLAEPAPQVAVAELADSSVNFVVRPWCNVADYWDVMFDITENLKLRADEQGISIPFPQRDIHVHQADKAA